MKKINLKYNLSVITASLLLLLAACSSPVSGTPVSTPAASLELTSTPAPTPTSTPAPTPTSTPAPTPTSTPAPTTTASVSPDGFPELINREHAILQSTPLTSEEEINRYLFKNALNGYIRFPIFAEDISMLHTAEEYMQLYPEILSMEMESLTKYKNGYSLYISNLNLKRQDVAYQYALRTGDTSYLNENELLAYKKLLTIAEELKLTELSDIDAIVAAHDYLVLNTAYDMGAYYSTEVTSSHSAEGTLLYGQAVCSGYASTFRLLMMLADIPCKYVYNDTHAWNLVQLDGEWYHIDVTWDDPTPDRPGVVVYKHFMMTDEEIRKLDSHHTWTCECEAVHICDDTAYRLYPYQEYLCSDYEEAARLILSQAEQNIITLVYPSDGSINEDELLQLTFQTLGLTEKISYYPSTPLGDSHYQFQIILR